MANETLILGNGNWASKANSLLGYGYGDTSKKFIPREFTFSRNSTATYTDENGIIQTADANIARVQEGALLLEPQRTNVHLRSTSMYNMQSFGTTIPTISRNTSVLDPSGTYNAALVTGGNGASGGYGIYEIISTTITSGQNVVVSCYAKAGTHDKIALQHANVTVSGGTSAFFDLATGTTPTAGASIIPVGNGWYRCIMQVVTFTANSAPSYNIGCYITPSTAATVWSSDFTGKSVYFYGIQVEVGAFATSLIPTTNTVATRLADSFTRNNIYTNGYIGASGGTWYVELKNNVAYTLDASEQGLNLGDNSNATLGNQFQIRSISSPQRLALSKRVGGAFTLLFTTTTDNVKIAFKWNGTTADIFVNGVKQVSATAFTTTALEFLTSNVLGTPKFIQSMKLYNTPLTDEELILKTTL